MRFLSQNRLVLLCCITLLLFFNSCSDEKIPEVLPDNSCAVDLAEGYTDKVSYYPNEKMTVFLQSTSGGVDKCRLNIHKMDGEIAFSVATPLFRQTISANSPSDNGYGYLPTVEITIPGETPSGVYLVAGKIPFVVKTHEPVDFTIIYPSNTVNAYATSGGRSLYTQNRTGKVSFLRPLPLQHESEICLQWFNSMKEFKIGYIADVDMDLYSSIASSSMLMIVGHSEYWSRRARLNFDQFVESGKHALIFSGNTMWWQIRYSPGHSEMLCYKDFSLDPEPDILMKTITWDDERLEYPIQPSIGADFPLGGYGLKDDKGWEVL